ncbi:hypothetical protein Tco_0816982 [Tanacetum coccineum]
MRLLTLWRGKLTKLVATVDAFCAFDYLLIRALHIKKKRNAKAMVVCRTPQLSLKSADPLSWRAAMPALWLQPWRLLSSNVCDLAWFGVATAPAMPGGFQSYGRTFIGTFGLFYTRNLDAYTPVWPAPMDLGEIGMYLGGAARRRACSHGQLHTLFPRPTLTNLSQTLKSFKESDETDGGNICETVSLLAFYLVVMIFRLCCVAADNGRITECEKYSPQQPSRARHDIN